MTREGYVLITADWASRKSRGKNAAAAELYRTEKAIAFWLPVRFCGLRKKSSASPVEDFKFEQAAMLFKCWPAIKRVANSPSTKPGDLFDVLDSGKVEKRP